MEIKSGTKFNRWTILGPVQRVGAEYKCIAVCDCGTFKFVNAQNVRFGKSKSCGCFLREFSQKLNKTHGMTGTKTNKIWHGIKRRCNNPNEIAYKDYGGRGIKVDPAWENDYMQFLADMGECPPGYSIERIDVNKGYSKDNCKWVPLTLQSWNTRKSKLTYEKAQEIRAEIASGCKAPELARRYGVDRTMVNKIVRGECWTAENAKGLGVAV